MFFRLFFLLILMFSNLGLIKSQGYFKGSVVMGFNAAQMNGDDLAGFNKIGLHGGLKLTVPISLVMDANLEMLYSQRGSQGKIIQGQANNSRSIALNYFELPLSVTYNDWYIEDGEYYKVGLDLGIAPAYLFKVGSNDPNFSGETFRNLDLSILTGLYYATGPHWTFRFRYTNGIIKIFDADATQGRRGLRSYFLTFRADYNF